MNPLSQSQSQSLSRLRFSILARNAGRLKRRGFTCAGGSVHWSLAAASPSVLGGVSLQDARWQPQRGSRARGQLLGPARPRAHAQHRLLFRPRRGTFSLPRCAHAHGTRGVDTAQLIL
jgi:hypothetical protein